MNYTEKEKEYFNNKLSQVIYNPNRFKVLIGEDRFLFGIVSSKIHLFYLANFVANSFFYE